MKAFVIHEDNGNIKSGFEELAEPMITDPTSVKVAVESVGICGTDII